jgi:hypothetical protein
VGQKLPLDIMLSIINDPSVSEARRDKFIIAAAPYLHPRLTSIAVAKAPFEMTEQELEETLRRQAEHEMQPGGNAARWAGEPSAISPPPASGTA